MPDVLELHDALRKTYANRESNVKAAVDLLIWHDHWLHRLKFTVSGLVHDDEKVYIAWHELENAYNADEFQGSTSQLAVLKIAIDLALDRYRFGIMGDAHREAILEAFTTALS